MKKVIVTIVLLGGVASAASAAGSLSGSVLEKTTSLPIPGAIVTVHVLIPDSIAFPDTSDASGAYAIEGIIPGNEIYVVMAGKPGYKGYYFRFDDLGAGSQTLDIVLEPETVPPGGSGGDSSVVSGQVLGRDGISGGLHPVAGAEVRLQGGTGLYATLTDDEGGYRTLVPPGSYAITTSAAGYEATGSGGVNVGPGGLIYGAVLVGAVTDVQGNPIVPDGFSLIGAYPNPFNPTTRIRYSVPAIGSGPTEVSLSVYDLLGREVAALVNETQRPGMYEVIFDAGGLPSGVYVFRLGAGPFEASMKTLLTR